MVTAAVLAGLVLTGLAVSAPGSEVAVRSSLTVGPGSPAPAGPAAGRRGRADLQGLQLLTRAAQACRRVPFHGVEVLEWWAVPGAATGPVPPGPGAAIAAPTAAQYAGASISLLDVWHAANGQTLMNAPAPGPGWPGSDHQLALASGAGAPQAVGADAMLGLSPRLVALLGANYRVALLGAGRVAGRPARVVALWRPHGRLAALFWLDNATSLPLRRVVFDASGREFGQVRFAQLTIGAAAAPPMPGAAARPWGARPWGRPLSSVQLARLRTAGWPIVTSLPGRLSLLAGVAGATRAGPVIDLAYSDGLFAVSVFVQRGHLPGKIAGWSRIVIDGRNAYTDESGNHSIAWSAGGFVYTVLAVAPPRTAGQVVAALPHDSVAGFFARMREGLRQLLSWVSP